MSSSIQGKFRSSGAIVFTHLPVKVKRLITKVFAKGRGVVFSNRHYYQSLRKDSIPSIHNLFANSVDQFLNRWLVYVNVI